HGVAHKIVPIDMREFVERGIGAYVEGSYIADHLFRYFQIRLLETVDAMGGYAVLGGGEQVYYIQEKDILSAEDAYLKFDPGFAVPLEWCRRNAVAHQPYFYFSSSELCLAYLSIPTVDFVVTHPDIFRHPVNTYM